MEYSNNRSARPFVLENHIRHLQSKILSDIENIEKDVVEPSYIQTFNLCDIVKNRILTFEDEPALSKAQNNFRRIYIASELIVGICSVHECVVDFAFTKIMNDLLQSDKYKIISSRISHKVCSNLKKEKYFAKEAHNKLLKNLKGSKSDNSEEKEENRRKVFTPEEKELEIMQSKLQQAVSPEKEISLDKINLSLVDSLVDEQFNFIGDMTEVRVEPPAEVSNLNFHIGNIPNVTSLQPTEISIREPFVQQQMEENIIEILQSDDKITPINIRKSGLSENLLESVCSFEGVEGEAEKISSPIRIIENQSHSEENAEEWNLSTLEPDEIPQKKYFKSKTDELTVIPNYSIRAMNLNKNIEIRRVQVFEGPPRILQSMSSEYLMQTSGFKRFTSQNVRSSMLTKLYKRNLNTEKRPTEPFTMPKPEKRTSESKITERKEQTHQVLVEVGEKIGMRAASVKSGVLADLDIEKRHPEVLVNEMLEKNNLIGLPTSRIASPVIQPLEKGKINNAMPIPSPRIQQLQGTILDPKKSSPPWFFSTQEKPPRAEFCKFSYVKNKLRNYWSLFEMQGMEKSVSIREFLLFEEDSSTANYLTILRIVDKLSIQRQLFLDFKNGDILIKPYEYPYITQKQVQLKEKNQTV